jgi:hypothetical protein
MSRTKPRPATERGQKMAADFIANHDGMSVAVDRFTELFAPTYAAAIMLDRAAAKVLADPKNQTALQWLREARAQYAEAEAALDAAKAAAKPKARR